MTKHQVQLPPLFVAKFRSKFEASVAKQVMDADVDCNPDDDYEAHTYPVEIPSRMSRYTPEFSWPDRRIVIEV